MTSNAGWGRFAPSPTGTFHIGNLRTAVLAWLFAVHTGREFLIRMEDLDTSRVRPGIAEQQCADLRAMGLSWSGEIEFQSQRTEVYRDAMAQLQRRGLVYECFCTRREIHANIQESVGAPHVAAGFYAGTCRDLSASEINAKRATRPGAMRLRSDASRVSIVDELCGEYSAVVDDFVLQRGDGGFAYNLAVVVDDAAQGVDQVVRGDDLLESAPRQTYLAGLLGLPAPTYAHVPLVVGPTGQRLAKRDGAVTLEDLAAQGVTSEAVLRRILVSLHLAADTPANATVPQLIAAAREQFDPAALPREPWVYTP